MKEKNFRKINTIYVMNSSFFLQLLKNFIKTKLHHKIPNI